MATEIPGNDRDLKTVDIAQIDTPDAVARLFAQLGYAIDDRTLLPDPAAIGLGSADLRAQIRRAELLAKDPVDADIVIYLLEVRAVTAALRHAIARAFRALPEQVLLVLTTDYEELQFVLLERRVETGTSRGLMIKQIVRPIALTVDRRNPDPVALRVLKRFTFTEADSAYQWEKLRSAYTLAEWSEQYFNNRALFSDYYLNQRLTDVKLTPAWAEDVRPIGRVVQQLLATARQRYTGQPVAAIRAGLYAPLFAQLGFVATPQPPRTPATPTPDYLLYAPGDESAPLAAALAYGWNRNLDDADETRDTAAPAEIPGALVVSLLEAAVAPWIIVTNGKLWRLYSATASNKATNYYEVDLEEALAAPEQVTALKYWWLLFRRQAFAGFLEMLRTQSAEYAKELGARLKDEIFTEIFPQFARGFLAGPQLRAQPDAELLPAVFAGTMTFLYRLMFVHKVNDLSVLQCIRDNDVSLPLDVCAVCREPRSAASTGGARLPGSEHSHAEKRDRGGGRHAARCQRRADQHAL